MAKYGKFEAGVLEFERLLPGPIERVWEFLTDPELRAKWICGGRTEPRAGGVIRLDFDNTRLSKSPPPEKYADQGKVAFEGEVLVYEPPHRLAFTWPESGDEVPSQVSITLSEEGGKVRLVLRHERLGRGDFLNGAAAGWHAHLDLLADNLEGRQLHDFWTHHTALEAEYEQRLGA